MRYLLLLLLSVAACNRSTTHYVDRGNEFFKAGNYKDAEINYRNAVNRDGNSGEAHYKLALIRLEQNDMVAAHTGMKRASELLPDRADIKARAADVALRLFTATGMTMAALHDDAHKLTAELLKRDPNSPDGLRLQGYLAILATKPKDAIESFRKALAILPNQPEVKLALVQAYFQNQQFIEGEKEALACIESHPAFAAAYQYLYEYYASHGRLADAEEVLKRNVANSPKDLQARLKLASHYTRVKNTAASDTLLNAVLADPQSFPDANLEVGDFYRRSARLEDALKHYDAGVHSSSSRKGEYLRRSAETHWARGNLNEALRQVDTAIELDSREKSALTLKAQMLIASGKPELVQQATATLQAAIQNDPADVIARQQLASAYVVSGNVLEARKQLAEVVRRKPGDVASLLALGTVCQKLGQNDESVRYASEALKYQPGHAPARLLLATGLIGTGRQAEARSDLSSLVRDQPGYVAAALQLALLNTSEKRYRESDALLQELYRPGISDVQVVRAVVSLYAMQKQFDRAAKVLEEEIRLRPQATQLKAMLASIDAAAGRYEKAIDTLKSALGEGPTPELYLQLVQLHRQKKHLPTAVTVVDRALDDYPRDVRLLKEGAILYELQQDKVKAVAVHRRLLELQPDDAEAKNNVAYSIADADGDLNEALRLADSAVKQAPQSAAYADTMAWIHLKRGDKETAVHMLQKLVQRHPDNPSYREHLNKALAHTR